MNTFNCSLRKVFITIACSDDLFSCPADRPTVVGVTPPQDGDELAVLNAIPIGAHANISLGNLWVMSNSGVWSRVTSIESIIGYLNFEVP